MHTVEKIGGSSMSRFQDVLDNILIGERKGDELYNRIFVVSAYAGITDKLLEHKKNRKPGVYALFCDGDSDWAWGDALSQVSLEMCKINAGMFEDPHDLEAADKFVKERVEGVRSCLMDLQRLCSFGHFQLEEHLLTVREMLSAIGEAHSAHNTTLLLKRHDINACFLDLSGWRDSEHYTLDEKLKLALAPVDLKSQMPVVTGYAQCREGLMKTFDRGYTEITFSRMAVLTDATEAIIHKEFHLSSADPRIAGEDKVKPIGQTNYDVADQLANMGMEAIHPRAAKGLRQSNIPLRVKNTFEPDHRGTLISNDYQSAEPCVEIIAGLRGIYSIGLFDQDMVGINGYEEYCLEALSRFKLKAITKDVNANTLVHYVNGPLKNIKRTVALLKEKFPQADVWVQKVCLVSAIGSDMKVRGLLSKAVTALSEANINIMGLHQSMRQVDIQFIIEEDNYETAVKALHDALVPAPEQKSSQEAA